MVDFAVTPARTALINIDMQNFFVEGHPNTPERLGLLERINRLSAVCRAAGLPVVHVAHVLEPDAANAGVLAEIYPTVRSVGFLNRGATTAALHPRLVVAPGDLLLEKPRYGAFHGTDLEQSLRARGIDTVIIAGIATNVCCDTTAREAHSRDFRALFLSDGTFTSSAALHEATLTTIGALFGQVLTIAEVLQKIESGAKVAAAVAERPNIETWHGGQRGGSTHSLPSASMFCSNGWIPSACGRTAGWRGGWSSEGEAGR